MVAFDPVERRAAGGYLASGERAEEAIAFLTWLRDVLGIHPSYVTMDFDDTWEVSVKAVFPDAKIIICTFHATQLLTRGLLKELNRLQREFNTSFIKECNIARKASLAIEKGKPGATMPACVHKTVATWVQFYSRIDSMGMLPGLAAVSRSYEAMIADMKTWNGEIAGVFEERTRKKIPARGLTARNPKGFVKALRTAWRTVLKEFRVEGEKKKREFARAKFLLLKKPGKMAEWEQERLSAFLETNAWANPLRETLIKFYELLDDPPCENPSLEFLNALVHEKSHDWLKSAVATLQTKREQVFNFVRAWKEHPELKNVRTFKVNPEHLMRKVNDMVRVQYGLRSDESKRYKIEMLLGCPVAYSPTVLEEIQGDHNIA